VLGNIESQRDWGRCQDYVQAMWLMLQYHTADDYIVATGESHSVRDFVEAAFAVVDLPWQKYVKHDSAFDRPAEPTRLVGCADKIRKKLGWKPAGTFRELVREMVEAELAAIGRMQNENAD
jgi:GDPmannose 4,6-dehydratase